MDVNRTRASKGHQLFALRVDQELQSILLNYLCTNMTAIDEGFAEKYRPELEAAVAAAYYSLSFAFDKPTPGMAVFQLSMQRNSSTGVAATGINNHDNKNNNNNSSSSNESQHQQGGEGSPSSSFYRYLPVLVVLAQYVHKRLDKISIMGNWRAAPAGSWKLRMHRVLRVLDTCFRVAGVANTLLFLWYGAYPSLLQRASGLQMMASSSSSSGASRNGSGNATVSGGSYDPPEGGYSDAQMYYKTRQVGWAVATSLLGTLLWVFDWPGIRLEGRRWARRATRRAVGSVRQAVRKVLGMVQSSSPHSLTAGGVTLAPAGAAHHHTGTRGDTEPASYGCSCCGSCPAEMPFLSNCGHIYCYSCMHVVTAGFTATHRRGRGWRGLLRNRRSIHRRGDAGGAAMHVGSDNDDDDDDDEGDDGDDEGDDSAMAYAGDPSGEGEAQEGEERELYMCPVCDATVVSGERFSLK